MVRENLVESAVSFLQDPSVATSPLERRIAFLQSKNLTQEEIDAALARAGDTRNAPAQQTSGQAYGFQTQQLVRQQPQPYGYQNAYFQQTPPELPRRDWRDWFIMATVTSGVGYGLYLLAKRYVYPMIAPPTPPQLEQDKAYIDEQFNKAFALIDQLSSDTASLKASETARTERLDSALVEVETVISELKQSTKRREEETRRVGDEVRALKDLIPKALEAQKESSEDRLKDLNTQLRGLKTLLANRAAPTTTGPATLSASSFLPPTSPGPKSPAPTSSQTVGSLDAAATTATPASATTAASSVPPTRKDINGIGSFSSFGGSALGGSGGARAAIPAWQMAAAQSSKQQQQQQQQQQQSATTPGTSSSTGTSTANASGA